MGIYSEAEQGGALVPEERFVNYFVTGVFNVMRSMGMLDGEIVEQGERLVVDPLSNGAQTARSPAERVLRLMINVGDNVQKGQAIAEIHTISGELEVIKSPQDGLITYIQRLGPTAKGERIAEISL